MSSFDGNSHIFTTDSRLQAFESFMMSPGAQSHNRSRLTSIQTCMLSSFRAVPVQASSLNKRSVTESLILATRLSYRRSIVELRRVVDLLSFVFTLDAFCDFPSFHQQYSTLVSSTSNSTSLSCRMSIPERSLCHCTSLSFFALYSLSNCSNSLICFL